ncbi:MAG: hypothetical protein E3J72_18260 [Planctomycetota bacterium]|nr:MAG: hypothetical protein E3J72_18260 [Planctomycetota bacterium]
MISAPGTLTSFFSRPYPILFLILSIALCSGCSCNTTPEQGSAHVKHPYLAAFLEGRYEEALAIVDKKLEDNPRDCLQLHYRGSCYTMLERHEDAIETFRLAQASSSEPFIDKTTLYMHALALFNSKLYCRSQQKLDSLAQSFPHSRMAKRGQELALKIEQRLGAGLKESNLNWYLSKGMKAYNSARPAMAAEYLEEYFLLADRAGDSKYKRNAKANFSLGGAYMELGDVQKAVVYLERIPIEYGRYRAGIMQAMAIQAAGDNDRAVDILNKVISNAKSKAVIKRAKRLRKDWTPK